MDLGSGRSYSENMSAASGGRGGPQNQAPSGFGGGRDSGGGSPDPYSGYVAASKPRTGIAAIKDYFTGGGYDYGYQPTFSKTLGGIGSLLLGMVNPVLGGLNYLRKNMGPELSRFRQAPTLDRYFNPEKYVNRPYVIGTNPMDTQRYNRSQFGQILNYPEYQKYQDEYNQKIARDLEINPEMQIFDLRNGIQTIDQPIEDPTVPENDPFDTDYYFDPEPMNKPGYGFTEDNTYAKLNNLEQAVYQNLKTRDELFQDLNEEQKRQLQELEQKKNQQGYLGSSTFVV